MVYYKLMKHQMQVNVKLQFPCISQPSFCIVLSHHLFLSPSLRFFNSYFFISLAQYVVSSPSLTNLTILCCKNIRVHFAFNPYRCIYFWYCCIENNGIKCKQSLNIQTHSFADWWWDQIEEHPQNAQNFFSLYVWMSVCVCVQSTWIADSFLWFSHYSCALGYALY